VTFLSIPRCKQPNETLHGQKKHIALIYYGKGTISLTTFCKVSIPGMVILAFKTLRKINRSWKNVRSFGLSADYKNGQNTKTAFTIRKGCFVRPTGLYT
jgi:hypothetical protein